MYFRSLNSLPSNPLDVPYAIQGKKKKRKENSKFRFVLDYYDKLARYFYLNSSREC